MSLRSYIERYKNMEKQIHHRYSPGTNWLQMILRDAPQGFSLHRSRQPEDR